MEQNTKIVFQDYIPNSLIKDFETLYRNTGFGESIQIEIEKQPEYDSFTGNDITDIVIYIENHTTGLIDGLIASFVYDFLKNGVKLLLKGLSNAPIKKLKEKGKEDDTKKRIKLKLEGNDKRVQITFDGDIKEEDIEKTINQALEFIDPDRLSKFFETPDLIWPVGNKPTIILRYNDKKQSWEPRNLTEYLLKIEKLEKDMLGKFSS